jgi:penicillin-binding protein 1C
MKKHSFPLQRLQPRFLLPLCGAVLSAFFLLLWAVIPSPVQDALVWPVSPALTDKDGRLFHVRLSSRGEYCLPVPLERMGKWLPLVAVEVEDRRFYSHPGLDPLALGRAVWQNMKNLRVVSGASTISSQTVRLTYPGERNLGSKAREFIQAMKLELGLDKKRILELYLNRAPFGGPVRGVEAAARTYFGKRAEELSLAEAALLIGMLRGPSVYRPDRSPEKTLHRRNEILRRLLRRSVMPQDMLEAALLEPLPPGRRDIPGEARHYADSPSAPYRPGIGIPAQNRCKRPLTPACSASWNCAWARPWPPFPNR